MAGMAGMAVNATADGPLVDGEGKGSEQCVDGRLASCRDMDSKRTARGCI
jgi:hypothetical protein